jgi:hypothetical protein
MLFFLPHCHPHAAKKRHSKRSCKLIDLEKSSDPPHPTNMPTNMLDILLNNIGVDKKTASDDQDNTATANILCENEMYQLLLGNDF